MGARQLQMLTKRLSLTTDQQTQVKSILDDNQKQMETLRNDTSTSREEKRPKMMEIRKSSDEKIRATLTDDQKTKYDAMQAEMRDRMKQRGDGPPPPPQQ
jgi:Spy/CpxP family protein refolding chaperone